jgi:hypothetical protein
MDIKKVQEIYAKDFDCDVCGRTCKPEERVEWCVDGTPVMWVCKGCDEKNKNKKRSS